MRLLVDTWVLFTRMMQCVSLVFLFYYIDWTEAEKHVLKIIG